MNLNLQSPATCTFLDALHVSKTLKQPNVFLHPVKAKTMNFNPKVRGLTLIGGQFLQRHGYQYDNHENDYPGHYQTNNNLWLPHVLSLQTENITHNS